jgi:hypothetical protein
MGDKLAGEKVFVNYFINLSAFKMGYILNELLRAFDSLISLFNHLIFDFKLSFFQINFIQNFSVFHGSLMRMNVFIWRRLIILIIVDYERFHEIWRQIVLLTSQHHFAESLIEAKPIFIPVKNTKWFTYLLIFISSQNLPRSFIYHIRATEQISAPTVHGSIEIFGKNTQK